MAPAPTNLAFVTGKRNVAWVLLVFLLAAAVRCPCPELTWFTLDQARDVTQARTILSGTLVLEGPAVGQTGMRLGPLYYYVVAFGLCLRDSPVDAVFLLALLNAAGVAGFFVLFRRMVGQKTAILAGLILALHPLCVIHGRALWNPALILPTTALYFHGLWLWAKEHRAGAAGWLLVGAALMLQAHLTTAILLPLALIGLFRRAPLRGPGVVVGGLLCLVFTVPWVWQALARFFSETGDLDRVSALFRSPETTPPAPYWVGLFRALTVESILAVRTLFGGSGWSSIVQAGGYLFSGLMGLGAIAFLAGRGDRRLHALVVLPALLLPAVVLLLMRQFSYYYYLECAFPFRALLVASGTFYLARRMPVWIPGGLLALGLGVGFVHLLGGLWLDARTGILRGHLESLDLRSDREVSPIPNLFPTLGSKKRVGEALYRRLHITPERLNTLGRGPWWPAFVDDRGFWILEAAGDGSADPFVLRPGIHLFIAHDRDPFPAPHDPSSGEIVRAGSFTLIPFRTGIDSRKLELCVFQKGGEGMWVPFSTESLPFVNSDPDRVRWPGAEVEIRASLVVEIPSPRRIVLYFLTTLGAEVTGMTVNGKPLARTFLFERLGWCLSGYRWEPPLPGRHEVQVSLRSPDDRKAPIYFELFDVRTEPDR